MKKARQMLRTLVSGQSNHATGYMGMRRASQMGLLFVSLLGLSACGPELDPISEVKTLRIMGLSKSAPYARPGEEVDLHMLWEDGREDAPDGVETFIAFWCVNPPGGQYSGCLVQSPNVIPPQVAFNQSGFTITIPDDILRPSATDPRLPDSGSAYVYYGACSGKLEFPELTAEPDPSAELGDGVLPKCLGEEGEELGPDDFVIGYSTIFAYEELRNENPILTGFQVNGTEVEVECIDDQCDGPFVLPDLDACQEGLACIKPCEDDGAFESCPEIRIEALIDPASREPDELQSIAYGNDIDEAIWVSYFVDRGAVSPSLKLVNEATAGWQPDFGTSIFAPKDVGPMRIWAVVRDSRGGSAWVRVPAYVQ